MSLVLDASVFVASLRSSEPRFQTSIDFLEQVQAARETTACPTLVLPECSGAISRATGDTSLAGRVAPMIEGLAGLSLVPVTHALAREAAQLAASLHLRGADSIYVAVARQTHATLISWDQEMLDRGKPAVETATPAQWLEEHAGSRAR